jgi:hypothetical protein
MGGLKERPRIETRWVKHEKNHNLGGNQREPRGTKEDEHDQDREPIGTRTQELGGGQTRSVS